MANAVTIPTPTPIACIPETQPRAQFVYAEGKRTDTAKTNEKGQPLYGFAAMVHAEALGGTVGGVRISTPLAELPELGFGEALSLTSPVFTIRNNRDGFDLSISIEGSGIEGQPSSRRSMPAEG